MAGRLAAKQEKRVGVCKAERAEPPDVRQMDKTAGKAKPCFVEVSMPVIAPPTSAPAAHTPEILVEKGDVKIHIPMALGNSGLRAVIESLGAAL